jgi:hypothetical protein
MDPIEMHKRVQQMQAGGASGQQIADFAEDLVAQTHEGARRSARAANGIMAVVLGGMAVAAGLAAIGAARGADGTTGSGDTAFAAGFGALVLAGFAAVLARNFFALRPPPRELVASGVPARLTVRDYRSAPGGFRMRSDSSSVDFTRVAIDLDVAPSEGAPYAVTVREYLTGRAFVSLKQGAVLRGYVDRTRPGRIFIDWRARA